MGNCSSSSPSSSAQVAQSSSSAKRDILGKIPHLKGALEVEPSTSATEAAPPSAPPEVNPAGEPATDLNLLSILQGAASLLGSHPDEAALTKEEIKAALKVYHELQRVLSTATRSGDWMARPSKFRRDTDFRDTFNELMAEFDSAEESFQKFLQSNPAAVRPLSVESVQEVKDDFFILDNSLRETTVGAPRGHTLEEKHKIVDAIADTGLEEIILGSFGSKIAVDSQIAERWKTLGKSFDNAWGFSDAYDMEPFDEERLWTSVEEFKKQDRDFLDDEIEYYTPPTNPKHKFSNSDLELVRKASNGFQKRAFAHKTLRAILKENESTEHGRLPLGLLMLKGYGICNAIVELETSVETFDYDKYDPIERCKYLIRWCKDNLPPRQNVPREKDNTPRVLIGIRDFTNFDRSKGGTEEALRLIDALSRLPPDQRPFGFVFEEPTNWLLPHEVGRLIRMVRLTMQRAGFAQGRLLVHMHMNFGLGEASQLAAHCNGADGVWAAVCKVGAQVGHACSTVTAVNLFRSGKHEIATKYNLEKMCDAARKVTEICTRAPCPSHEEVYGELAFDVPFFMTNLPSCKYAFAKLLESMGIDHRRVRLNELSMVSAVKAAMVDRFGPPEESGWDPAFCQNMWDAIHNHMLTGLSRDYNSNLGLGHLYALVSKKSLPTRMVAVMTEDSPISDYHPTVLEFIQRWNRLCAQYEGEDPSPHPIYSNSNMVWSIDVTVNPRRETLPFDYFIADVMRNSCMEPVPRLFKMQVVSLLTANERKLQGQKNPMMNFYESIIRLKLFISEAESLGVLGLVDDFCLRKNHDFFFGEDNLWLQEVRGSRPTMARKLLRKHIDFFPNVYTKQGNNMLARCVKSAARRIDLNEGIQDEIQALRRGSARLALQKVIQAVESDRSEMSDASVQEFTKPHEEILQALANDEGEDKTLAANYLEETKQILGLASTVDDVIDFEDVFLDEMKCNVGLSESKGNLGVEDLMQRADSANISGELSRSGELFRRGSEALMTVDPRLLQLVKDSQSMDFLVESEEEEDDASLEDE